MNPTQTHTAPETAPGQDRPLRPFFILWSGQSLSLLGSQAVQFAIIWWLTKETGSATILSLAALFGLLPQVVLGPVIGSLIDRWNRKRIMLAADSGVALASLVLAWLFATGNAGIPHILALLFVRSLGAAFQAPAMTASTTLMVPERFYTRIQGLNQSLQGLLLIASAPLGVLLLELLPMTGVMMVDVATALVAILPLLFIHVPQPARSEATGPRPTLWKDTADGFAYLWRRRGHFVLVSMAAAINALLVPAFSLLSLLVLERLNGNAAQFAWLNSIFGVGLIVGGVALSTWGGFRRKIVTSLTGMIALGVAVILLGATPGSLFGWALAAMLLVGMTVPLVNGPIHAILQATIAPEFQGRVFTLVTSLSTAVAPLGLVVAAPVAEWVGVGTWYVAGGVVCLAMGIAGFFVPALLAIEEGEPREQVAPAPATG